MRTTRMQAPARPLVPRRAMSPCRPGWPGRPDEDGGGRKVAACWFPIKMHKHGDQGHNGREKSGLCRWGCRREAVAASLRGKIGEKAQGLAGSGSVTKPIL